MRCRLFLGERPFLLTDRPTSADTAVFGLLAPTVYWSMETPVAIYARSLPNLRRTVTGCVNVASPAQSELQSDDNVSASGASTCPRKFEPRGR